MHSKFNGVSQGICYLNGRKVTAERFAQYVAKTDFKLHSRLKTGRTFEEIMEAANRNVANILASDNELKEKNMSNKQEKVSLEALAKQVEQLKEKVEPVAPGGATEKQIDAVAATLKAELESPEMAAALSEPTQAERLQAVMRAVADLKKKVREIETILGGEMPKQEKKAPEKKARGKRTMTPEQIARLNAAREEHFKKMGYGKYKKTA